MRTGLRLRITRNSTRLYLVTNYELSKRLILRAASRMLPRKSLQILGRCLRGNLARMSVIRNEAPGDNRQ